MEKIFLLLRLCLLSLCAQTVFAQTPQNWDGSKPLDNDRYRYVVGVSHPATTEQEAWTGARQDAVQQFAASIAIRFEGQTDITVQSATLASGIEDTFTIYMETAAFSTSVPVTGINEIARRIDNSGGRFVARILTSMSVEDYNRSRLYLENEEAAFLAYNFFRQRNLFTATANRKPSGYDDYYSWLRNNTVTISFNHPNENALLEQLDQFITKLYRNAVVFAQIVNGRGVRIVYNSGRYYDGILRALQNTSLFAIQRESGRLVLTPARQNILGDMRAAVADIKDSGRFVITGLETIQTRDGDVVNTGNIVINQFRTIASRQFNMQAVNYTVPRQYIDDYVDEDGIIRHIQNNFADFPARYLVIAHSETRLERGMPEYRIPPLIVASARFSLYDVVTGEIIQSDTVQTASGAFSPSSLEDRAVMEESRRALQFLSNPRTQPGLEDIMRRVFNF